MFTSSSSLARKLLVAYLSLTTLFAPIAPALAQAAATPATVQQALPELGGAKPAAPSDAPREQVASDWLLHAGTDPSLSAGALHPRSQGIEDAVAKSAGLLSGAASEATEAWFASHHITSALSLSVDDQGVNGGSLDVLVPFHRGGKNLLFGQGGMRRANTYTEDYRHTMNLGVGYRRDAGNWLLGTNAFFDRDVTGKHDRFGVGLEAWTDYLKLSANTYLPLTSWKASPDRPDYLERPAKGWDLRAEGYLPVYPQLGAKLILEQYQGNEVSLFSSGDRQKDPGALTVGAIYNPIPMVAVGVNHRMGQDGLADTSANLTLNYRIGEPLARQLSSGNVSASRLLENMRYDLVARNNEIVLDNREASMPLRMPAELSGTEGETLKFTVVGTNRFNTVAWAGDATAFAQPLTSNGQGSLTLPLFVDGGNNTYSLQAVGVSQHGQSTRSNMMTVTVTVGSHRVEANPPAIVADGVSTSTLVAIFKEPVGPGVPVKWSTTAGALASDTTLTDANGVAHVVLTSSKEARNTQVTAHARGTSAVGDVMFTAGAPGSSSSALSLSAAPSSILADGKSTSNLNVTVRDEFGNLVGAGVQVKWQTSAGTLAGNASATDANGVATMVLTSATLAGAASVQASVGTASRSTTVNFTAGVPAGTSNGLTLTAKPASITADGTSATTLSALVKDVNDNPVDAGVEVKWSASAGSLGGTSSYTDATGTAHIVLRSGVVAGSVAVEASAGAARDSATVNFTAGNPAAGTAGLSLQVAPSAITADGTSTTLLTATVKDANGNLVAAGEQVNWSSTLGALDGAASVTDNFGVATMRLTSSTTAGKATVEASANAARNSATVSFTAGGPAAGTAGLSLEATPPSITADGLSTTTLTATLKDVNGNLVGAGVPVTWTTSAGTLVEKRTASTDANGVATVQLISATRVGTATVEATSGAAKNQTSVTFIPGNPAAGTEGLQLSVTPAGSGDRAVLNATVKDKFGNLVGAGVVVSWTTTAGKLADASSATDANGVATTELSSTLPGEVATVTATSGVARDTATIEFDAGVPGIGSTGLSLSVVLPDGSDTATFSATLRDAYGNMVPAGAVVNWTTSNGALAGAVSSTDANGVATMVLTGKLGTTAYVQATSGAARNGLTVSFVVGAPAPGSAGLSLVATPASIVADGTSTSVIRATLRDSYGSNVGGGVTVTWAQTAGTLNHTSSVTDSNGVAEVVLTSAKQVGIAQVTASSGGARNSVDISMVAGAPAAGHLGLSVSANPAAIAADGSSVTTLSAVVMDAQGNHVGAGLTVAWTTTAGTLASTSTVTDTSGVARVQLTSSTQVTTATIGASTGAAANTGSVRFTALEPASVNVLPAAATLTADGSSNTVLTATVRDVRGQPVPAGTQVSWTTSAGTLASGSSSTNASGEATVLLTSSTVASTATVQATAGVAKNSASVVFIAGVPAGLAVTTSASSILADGKATAVLTAQVWDARSNPVAGATVTWTTTAGAFTGASAVTDSRGIATRVLTSATKAGMAIVHGTAGSATSAVAIQFNAGVAARITNMKASPDTIDADGSSATVITAQVWDAQGNLVGAGVDMDWTTTSTGKLHSGRSQTNSSGEVMMVLTSSTAAGTFTVAVLSAENTRVAALVPVKFVGLAVATVNFTTSRTNDLVRSNTNPIMLYAILYDRFGTPVGPGRTVTWHMSGGIKFESLTTTTDSMGRVYGKIVGTSSIDNTQYAWIKSESVSSNTIAFSYWW